MRKALGPSQRGLTRYDRVRLQRALQRVLFGALNPRTGHQIALQRPSLRQEDFQTFLGLLRARHPGRPLYLLLDKAGCHTAASSQALAALLDIHLLWLPKQWSELNAMDHLWRALKQHVAANRQYPTVDVLAQDAEARVLGLSAQQALRKAGVLSRHFWLHSLL